MCGIVGFSGDGGVDFILSGLRRLEYRGYDSAGLAVVSHAAPDGLRRVRCVGRVAELESESQALRSAEEWLSGIGHTRWATHGRVTVENAHPHTDASGTVAVVHNGIIENYRELRSELMSRGVVMTSETDTEVIAHLIGLELASHRTPAESVMTVLPTLRGTYGLAVLFRSHPGTIVVARNGSPVVVSASQRGSYVASDPAALFGVSSEFTPLEDGEVATLEGNCIRIVRTCGTRVTREAEPLDIASDPTDTCGHDHFIAKEIFEQPESIAKCTAGRIVLADGNARLSGMALTTERLSSVTHVGFIGCGTSLYAGMVGALAMERWARLRTSVTAASEFRYGSPIVSPTDIYVAVSQSGETADTLGAANEAILKGATVVGVVNSVGSSLARLCGRGTYMHSGPEVSVASTKAFTSQVVTLLMMSLMVARSRDMSQWRGQAIAQSIMQLPSLAERCLEELMTRGLDDAVNVLSTADSVSFIGRGPSYAVALEGALKLKELAYIPSHGYQMGELKHGPLALAGPSCPTVAVFTGGHLLEKSMSCLAEVSARGSRVIAVCDNAAAQLSREAGYMTVEVPWAGDEMLSPVLTVIPLQMMAYLTALILGRDIDRPRNLAKSVTVE